MSGTGSPGNRCASVSRLTEGIKLTSNHARPAARRGQDAHKGACLVGRPSFISVANCVMAAHVPLARRPRVSRRSFPCFASLPLRVPSLHRPTAKTCWPEVSWRLQRSPRLAPRPITVTSMTPTITPLSWNYEDLSAVPVPSTTSYILVEVGFNNASLTTGATDYDGYVDDANLTLSTPEPASISLLASGAIALLAMRSRRSA